MKQHDDIVDLLPQYVSGRLDAIEQARIERHLAECAECQSDLAVWRLISDELAATNRDIVSPPMLAERALACIHAEQRRPSTVGSAIALLRAQIPLVRGEIWPASLLIMAIGCLVALISGHAHVIRVMSPLIAAACLATILNPEHDPAMELALSTATSPRHILLARLTLVYGYNLLLALLASLGMLDIVPIDLLGQLILEWLGPMTFLSALALVLSLRIGASNAISISYGMWLLQLLAAGLLFDPGALASLQMVEVLGLYQQFWNMPILLLGLAALLGGLAIWQAGRPGSVLPHST